MHDWPWSELDIAPTADRAEIKRAYAAKLKTLDRERDVEGFQALREAYEAALPREATISSRSDFVSFPNVLDDVESGEILSSGTLVRERPNLDEVVDAIERLTSNAVVEGSLLGVLRRNEDLEDLSFKDEVGYLLARRLCGTKLSWTTLRQLVEFFGWSDRSVLMRWPDAEFRHRMDRWLGIAEVSAWIDSPAVPDISRRHFKKISLLLMPPGGFWRAFLLGATPWTGLGDSIERVQRCMGSRWDLFVTPEVQAYYNAIVGVRFDPVPWFAALIGQITLAIAATVLIMAVLWPMSDRGPPALSHYWMTAVALLWVLYVRGWRLLINQPYTWATWLGRQAWLFATLLYASTIVVIVLTVGR